MKEHDVNKLNNFICGWYTDDHKFCDDIISYFKRSKPHSGQATYTNSLSQNPDGTLPIKISQDVFLEDPELLDRFYKLLDAVCIEYVKKYPYSDFYSRWGITESINIQHYNPNEGFLAWHTERGSPTKPFCDRHLVFMIYLNDVTDDGETEFYHQNVKVKPEKGLMLLWGSDWTFTHRGVTSKTQEKYVITGWLNFY